MSIIGLGVDLVEIVRFECILKKLKSRFAKRILSCKELVEYKRHSKQAIFLAKKFAIKEATSKAFGLGISHGLSFNQFEVFNDNFGKPEINLLGQAKVFSVLLGIRRIHVSLSDIKKYVYAVVLVES